MSMRGSMTFTPVQHEQHAYGIKTLIIYIPRVTRQKLRDKTRENDHSLLDKNSLLALEKPADWSYDFFSLVKNDVSTL